MSSPNYFQVDVSWPIDDGRNVDDIVIYNIESELEDSQVPANVLDSLTDLFLTAPPEPVSACSARVTSRPAHAHLSVAAVDILSSARNVEVFSSSGEYVVLAEGTRLDVAGERKLFLCQHTFDEPQPNLELKFVSMVDPQRLWLHSLHLTLNVCKANVPNPLSLGPTIDMDKVNAIMADMDSTVPDSAKGLMTAMTSMQKSKQRTLDNLGSIVGRQGPPTMASIMGMFASMGVTSQAPAMTSQKPSKKPDTQQNPPQSAQEVKRETDKNGPKSKTRKNKSGGKKGQNRGAAIEDEKKEKEKSPAVQEPPQNKPKSRPNSGLPSTQTTKSGKDNGAKQNEKKERPHNDSTSQGRDSTSQGRDSTSQGRDSTSQGRDSTSQGRDSTTQGQTKKEQRPKRVKDPAAPITQADLMALEHKLLHRINMAEASILDKVTSRVEASEQRIIQHMENLVTKMAAVFLSGSNMVNGGNENGANDMNLD